MAVFQHPLFRLNRIGMVSSVSAYKKTPRDVPGEQRAAQKAQIERTKRRLPAAAPTHPAADQPGQPESEKAECGRFGNAARRAGCRGEGEVEEELITT